MPTTRRWASAARGASGHAACMDTTAVARILRFLEREPVVWLSTVRPDGGPHLVPIWFWWDGDALLVFSKPHAQKVRNLRERPSVMLALGDAEDDFDVGMLEGRAELLDRPTREVMPAAHVAKYATQLAVLGLTAEGYAATYSQVIRIVPVRFLPWHGRTAPASAWGAVDRVGAQMRAAIRRVALGLDRPEPATF
jgi:PPOX class probable F420-dependent enzyme